MRCLIICSLLLLSINLYSQPSAHEISMYGGNSLFNFWTTSKDKFRTGYGISYISGIGYKKKINNLISIDIRTLYSNNDLILNETTILFNYIDIPVKFRYFFGARKRAYYSIGIFTSILTNVSVKSYSSQGELVDFYSLNDDFKRFNYGISGSLGFEFPINSRFKIYIETNNNLGIRTITWPYNGSGLPFLELKSNCISFLFGVSYKFPC